MQIVTSDDENLHVVSGDGKCRNHVISLGETSLVPILTHDLVESSPGLELLISTADGTLMCLGRPPESTFMSDTTSFVTYAALQSLPAEMRSYNDFYGSGQVSFCQNERYNTSVILFPYVKLSQYRFQ